MPSRISETLQNSLLIENRHILLPWGAGKKALVQQCHPDRVEPSVSGDTLYWDGPVVLSGLSGSVLEVEIPAHGGFESAWLWMACGYSDSAAEKTFRKAYALLVNTFGRPVPPYPDLDDPQYERIVGWEQSGFTIGLLLKLGPEFGDYNYACLAIIERRQTVYGVCKRGRKTDRSIATVWLIATGWRICGAGL